MNQPLTPRERLEQTLKTIYLRFATMEQVVNGYDELLIANNWMNSAILAATDQYAQELTGGKEIQTLRWAREQFRSAGVEEGANRIMERLNALTIDK